MIRSTLILVVSLAAPAFAQQGVWTGYVGGWQYTPQAQARYIGSTAVIPPTYAPYATYGTTRRNSTAAAITYMANQQSYWSQMNYVERQKDAARREAEELNDRRIALEQQERALAQQREQQAQEALRAAEEARRVAESERKIAEAKAAEADAARREFEFTKLQYEQKRLDEALEKREKEIAAREAERMKQPQTPGPKLYKWVDADGVTNLSTTPPPGK